MTMKWKSQYFKFFAKDCWAFVGRRRYCDGGLPQSVSVWLEEMCDLCHPKSMYICNGSIEERESIIQELIELKTLVKMKMQSNSFAGKSDPRDTVRDESRIFTAAYSREDFIPQSSNPSLARTLLGNYLNMSKVESYIHCRFHKCMKGKKMYVIPWMLGPPTGEIKLMGIQVTDSGLVALMTTMLTRCGPQASSEITRMMTAEGADCAAGCQSLLAKLVHSAGSDPNGLPRWPTDLDKYLILNIPEKSEIWSYGSNYWENALLIKKGAALQIASYKGKKEKWLAANMSVLKLEDMCGKKHYVGVMGPCGSGKSVMAAGEGSEIRQTKITMVSDDIAWIKYNKETCRLHAINPEIGLFPLVKGISKPNTPSLCLSACSNSVILNVATAGQNNVYWEGQDLPPEEPPVYDWRGKLWSPEGPRAAHFDARFCGNIMNMKTVDSAWESGKGVPLSAILVATRRPSGHPLIMETGSWSQGIFHAASIRTRKHNAPPDNDELHWEPLGSRSYLGYNLGLMLESWLNLEQIERLKLPRIYVVNLFLMDSCSKRYMWPGYEDNVSLIEWVVARLDCNVKGIPTPMGILPCEDDFNMPCSMEYPFSSVVNFSTDYWLAELDAFEQLMKDQMPKDVPVKICEELEFIKKCVC